MNLRIAENIRRLRQEQNLTQVQLADRLGVSYQAVSRWENETTYPDIELLPTIAALFGVTVDTLLGSTSTDQKESLRKQWDILNTMTDPRLRVAHLRQMRRDFPEDWYLLVRLSAEVPSLEEKRQLTQKLVTECPIPYMRSRAIRDLIRAESEDCVMERMYQYNVPEECWLEFLEDRYRSRGDVEAYRKKRQMLLAECLRRAMMRMTVGDTDILPMDPKADEEGARTVLRVISALTGYPLTHDHPVAGEGEPDLWINQRVWAGITVALSLSTEGDGEGALRVLEDAADLLCRIRALPDDMILSYHTAGLDSLDTTRGRLGGIHYHAEHMAEQFSHEGFDALRRDPRYGERFEICCRIFSEGGEMD